MRITKFGHSCLLVEQGDARIMLDPGMWSYGHTNQTGVQALFITHEHPDHCDIESIQTIRSNNSGITIYTNQGAGKKLAEADIPFELFTKGDTVDIQGLSVEGFGTDHAAIYPTFPRFDNTGYFIGGRLFHPGDSVDIVPAKQVEFLALPVIAPWMRIADCLDYARHIKPKVVFPIHDGMLKHTGPFHRIPKDVLESDGIVFRVLEQGVCADFSV